MGNAQWNASAVGLLSLDQEFTCGSEGLDQMHFSGRLVRSIMASSYEPRNEFKGAGTHRRQIWGGGSLTLVRLFYR
ncbi:hypothetical protein FA13DRAFT_1728950 [Coprinellus micaceus]|uniref:Uncharacterized protein n=1 Tax=Coprinellus micaceus TaxID=71717 RepID=A0A4Y7TLS1_COPMI|nr:hypothetical protein FA13DRAFT_1728950 [Coprinellus micaceus]